MLLPFRRSLSTACPFLFPLHFINPLQPSPAIFMWRSSFPCPFHCSCCNLSRNLLLLHSFNMTTPLKPEGFHKICISALCNMFFITFLVLILPCSPSLMGPCSRKTQLSTHHSASVERQLVTHGILSCARPHSKDGAGSGGPIQLHAI